MGVKRQPEARLATYDTLHYAADAMFTGLNVSERAWLDEENGLHARRTEYGGRRSIKENEHESLTCDGGVPRDKWRNQRLGRGQR